MQKRYYVWFDDFERRVLVNCLNEMRTRLLEEEKNSEPAAISLTQYFTAIFQLIQYLP